MIKPKEGTVIPYLPPFARINCQPFGTLKPGSKQKIIISCKNYFNILYELNKFFAVKTKSFFILASESHHRIQIYLVC